MDHLIAIGCDDTNEVVGKCHGVIRMHTTYHIPPYQWIICLLHMNELLFRHLFQHIFCEYANEQSITLNEEGYKEMCAA